MKSHSSVLFVIGAASLAALTGVTVACTSASTPPTTVVTSPPATTAPSPTATATTQSPATSSNNQSSQPVSESTDDGLKTTTVSHTVESCVVRMAMVNDPDSPLNVRSTPDATADNVVGQLKNKTYVTVVKEQDGWFQITTPTKGWVAKNRTESGCNQKVERIDLNGSTQPVTINDRFVGTGSHRYVITASAGQTIIVDRNRGPMPSLIAPDGKFLLEGPLQEKRQQWRGKLAQTGEYVLELDSNFKGYNYTFSVEVN